jgi:hypothetical protein
MLLGLRVRFTNNAGHSPQHLGRLRGERQQVCPPIPGMRTALHPTLALQQVNQACRLSRVEPAKPCQPCLADPRVSRDCEQCSTLRGWERQYSRVLSKAPPVQPGRVLEQKSEMSQVFQDVIPLGEARAPI